MGIGKIFDSLGHYFLISTLEKCGFGKKIYRSGHLFLMAVQLYSIFCLEEASVKMTQF